MEIKFSFVGSNDLYYVNGNEVRVRTRRNQYGIITMKSVNGGRWVKSFKIS